MSYDDDRELFADDEPADDRLDNLTARRLIAALDNSTGGLPPKVQESTLAMMLHRWHSRLAAMEAVDDIVTNYTGPGRPPWSVLHGAYRKACARRGLTVEPPSRACRACGGSGYVSSFEPSPISGELTSYARKCSHPLRDQAPEPVIPPREGRAIARAVYLADCDARGVEPSTWALSVIDGVGR